MSTIVMEYTEFYFLCPFTSRKLHVGEEGCLWTPKGVIALPFHLVMLAAILVLFGLEHL